jgi:hypothetical protein
MRSWLFLLGPLGVCLGLPSLAFAQDAPLLVPAPATPAAWEITWPKGLPAETPPPAVSTELRLPIERNPLIDVDVLLGLPTAARVGVAVFRHNEQALLVEATAGLEAVIIPFVAVGTRYRFVAWHGQRTEWVIKPGVDAFVADVPHGDNSGITNSTVFGIGVDVASVFLHNSPNHGWEWGLDLGAIGGGGGGVSGVLPIVSFIFGFNF